MVEAAESPAQQTQWGPTAAGVAGWGLLGVALAILCVTSVTDPPGRILVGIAAAGLILFAAVSWHARPKLAITSDGLAVRSWRRTQILHRPDIKLIRITEFRRIGRKTRLLEIDTFDDRFMIFSRWDLGTDPLAVLDALTAAGYAGPGK